MEIDGRKIGTGVPPYIVAEIGAGWVWHHPMDSCLSLMRAAREAGADAIKIQVYKPEDLTVDTLPALTSGPWAGMTLWEIYERGSLPEENLPGLFEAARELGITLFASVFAERVIPTLEALGCPAYKIASAELCHQELLWAVGATQKPVIMSTGLASWDDIYHARTSIPHDDVALLHCVAHYPIDAARSELSRLRELKHRFNPELVGLSDHTQDSTSAIAAVALGATIVEKHIAYPGSLDAAFALRTYEFKDFVQHIRAAWEGLRPVEGDGTPAHSLLGIRRSIRATCDIAVGQIMGSDNIAVLRPAGGAAPQDLSKLIGAVAARDIAKGEGVLVSDKQ